MYNYNEIKPYLFTEDGQVEFLRIRDKVKCLLKKSGAIRMEEAMSGCVDSNHGLACVDRLVELGELRETKQNDCFAQHRVFVEKN